MGRKWYWTLFFTKIFGVSGQVVGKEEMIKPASCSSDEKIEQLGDLLIVE